MIGATLSARRRSGAAESIAGTKRYAAAPLEHCLHHSQFRKGRVPACGLRQDLHEAEPIRPSAFVSRPTQPQVLCQQVMWLSRRSVLLAICVALVMLAVPRTTGFLAQRLSTRSARAAQVRPLQASSNGMSQKNVLGGQLEACADGCGFFRDGFCRCFCLQLHMCMTCHSDGSTWSLALPCPQCLPPAGIQKSLDYKIPAGLLVGDTSKHMHASAPAGPLY